MNRIDIGEVIEIPTRRGFAYAQYTHDNKLMGSMIRVLRGLYERRPSDIDPLVREEALYVTFFPVEAAARQRKINRVGRHEVPAHARKFPLFRAAGQIQPGTGAVLDWWLWDGEREWRVDHLSPEQETLPLREIVTPPLLVERLEEGWTPGTASVASSSPSEFHAGVGTSPVVSRSESQSKHFLYFPTEERTKAAASAAQQKGYATEVQQTSDEWLLLAWAGRNDEPDRDRGELEQVARRFDGKYDGWEAPVTS